MARFLSVLAVAVVLGLGIGYLQYNVVHGPVEERMGNMLASLGSVRLSEGDTAVPKIAPSGEPIVEVVGGPVYNFGEMLQGAEKSHGFVIRNTGGSTLTLKVAGSTCKCTIGTLEDASLEPGENTTVMLKWKAQGVLDRFGQSATITTNDPKTPQLELRVEGNVIRMVTFEPGSIDLTDVSATQPYSRKLYMVSRLEEPVIIESVEWGDAKVADKVHLTHKSIDVKSLTGGEAAKATSASEIEINIDPGLPIGAYETQLLIKTNVEGMTDLLVPVTGQIVGDFEVIAGSRYNTEKRILDLGKVDKAEGLETKFHVSVQGEHREKIELSIGEVVPGDLLNVRVGEPIKRSNRTLYPIICSIPKDASPVSFPGTNPSNFGKITIQTNHPNTPTLNLFLRLRVE